MMKTCKRCGRPTQFRLCGLCMEDLKKDLANVTATLDMSESQAMLQAERDAEMREESE